MISQERGHDSRTGGGLWDSTDGISKTNSQVIDGLKLKENIVIIVPQKSRVGQTVANVWQQMYMKMEFV